MLTRLWFKRRARRTRGETGEAVCYPRASPTRHAFKLGEAAVLFAWDLGRKLWLLAGLRHGSVGIRQRHIRFQAWSFLLVIAVPLG